MIPTLLSKNVIIIFSRFLLLVFFQIFILNHLNIGGYINPLLYTWFILILPFFTPGWVLLLTGFLLGITIDLFMATPGLNAAATVLMAFFRPYVIGFLSRGSENEGSEPSLKRQGFRWFAYYSLSLVFIHHLALFFLEYFQFDEFFQTMLLAATSTFSTVILIFFCELLFRRREK